MSDSSRRASPELAPANDWVQVEFPDPLAAVGGDTAAVARHASPAHGGGVLGRLGELLLWAVKRSRQRRQLYDLLYSMNWGDTTTNNYGFAPAEGSDPERFQVQLYDELLKLLGAATAKVAVRRVLEISCGRGGGLGFLASRLQPMTLLVGLDFSAHAISFCRQRYSSSTNLRFIRGNALHLPFGASAFDVVVSVEASHAYRDDDTFLDEVARVLRPGGRFLFADYRTRRKIHLLEELAHETGLLGDLSDITPNVVAACELDAARRQELIRCGAPWYVRYLFSGGLARYSGMPGTCTFERFRTGERMYFMTCMTRAGIA
ncbi:MAG: class I SAM-dependent methyltransferase [Geminicoccaceae bacterium]